MKISYILAAVLMLGLGGCQGKPTEAMGRENLEKALLAKYAGRASLIDFKQTKAEEGIWFGVKFLDMDYNYEFACNNSIQIKGLENVPVEDVERLQHFFSKQTAEWDKIDFTGMPNNIQLGSGARETIYKAYGKKQSLILCGMGERVQGSGRMRFLLRENGWEAEK